MYFIFYDAWKEFDLINEALAASKMRVHDKVSINMVYTCKNFPVLMY